MNPTGRFAIFHQDNHEIIWPDQINDNYVLDQSGDLHFYQKDKMTPLVDDTLKLFSTDMTNHNNKEIFDGHVLETLGEINVRIVVYWKQGAFLTQTDDEGFTFTIDKRINGQMDWDIVGHILKQPDLMTDFDVKSHYMTLNKESVS